MRSDEDKDLVMANLKELKGKEQYKGVSITDDHTIKERNTLREWVKKPKRRVTKNPPIHNMNGKQEEFQKTGCAS